MSFHQIKLSFAFIQKEREPFVLIRKEFNKVALLLNILDKFISLGDGMTKKILLRKF